jgi:hypothetical protein
MDSITMVMSALDPNQLAELLVRQKLVLIPYAEYQSLLEQAKTLASVRALMQSTSQPPSAASEASAPWENWRVEMNEWIDARPGYSPDDKQDLKDQIGRIQAEAAKGSGMDMSRLEKLINTLSVIGPDVFEVAMATLANPLTGLGVALKKIGDRARLEREAH